MKRVWIVFLAAVALLCLNGCAGKEERSESLIQFQQGDIGVEENDAPAREDVIAITRDSDARVRMIKLIEEYHGYIPFLDGETYYGEGYFKSEEGVDNRSGDAYGMDSLGYVIWVYRNTFGSADKELEEGVSFLKTKTEVPADKLRVGDIGVYSPDEQIPNHYGIYVGDYDGVPVFSHLSGECAEKYPCGHDRYSFLRSARDSYFQGNAPVEFTKFYRVMEE